MSNQKTVVITGCSSGFGHVTALHLARHGWQVFATVRKESDQARLLAEAMAVVPGNAGRLVPVMCDITNAEDVTGLGQTVAAATPRLAGLVNNAGTAFPAPLELLPLDELREQLEINVVGHLAVTQALLPSLKAGHGTIINVSSESGRVVFPITGAYHMSKFALEAMSDCLRIELAPFGVRVVVLEPGASPTAIWATSLQRAQTKLGGRDTRAYATLIAAVEKASARRAATGYPPQLLADLVLKVLNSPNPRARYPLPRQTAWIIALRQLLPDVWWDRIVRRVLKW